MKLSRDVSQKAKKQRNNAHANEQERLEILEDINSRLRLTSDIIAEDLAPNEQHVGLDVIPEIYLPQPEQDDENGYIAPNEIADETEEGYMGMMDEEQEAQFNE